MDFEDPNSDSDDTYSNFYESHDDDWEVEPITTDVNYSKEKNHEFSVLSPGDILQRMDAIIQEVNEVARLNPNAVRTLLNHFKWDKLTLMERLYDSDRDELFQEAHMINPYNQRAEVENETNKNASSECKICFQNILPAMMTGLECGHQFCEDCWREYLTMKIMSEGVGQSIACAGHNCDILVDYTIVLTLVNDCKVKNKYQNLLTNSYVTCSRYLTWCPKPGCSNAIEIEFPSRSKMVTCECGHEFCFSCSETGHEPIECQILKKWNKKSSDDWDTLNWISTNTKDCPICRTTLNKNGGCNFMTCANETWKYSFCWKCLKKVDGHNNAYKCNRFKDNEDENDTQKLSAREDVQRYLHFYGLYNAHKQSLKLETSADGPIEKKIQEIHNFTLQTRFRKAANVLSACRKILMHTYVFAYYVSFLNVNFVIFQDNQGDLEKATEALSGLLEGEITSTNIRIIQSNLVNKFTYCESRRKILIEHVQEGFDKEWWSYNHNLF